MKLTITPTDEFLVIEAGALRLPVRVWEGRAEGGARCRVLVAGVMVPEGEDPAVYDRELKHIGAVDLPDPW
jgi:hypothetical protein